MTGGTDLDTVYVGSDGRFYTADERERNLQAGVWRRCLRDESIGRELVATSTDGLMLLERIPRSTLPEWVEPRVDESTGIRLVDTRRSLPPGVAMDGVDPTSEHGTDDRSFE